MTALQMTCLKMHVGASRPEWPAPAHILRFASYTGHVNAGVGSTFQKRAGKCLLKENYPENNSNNNNKK